jgi:hypothetical protein
MNNCELAVSINALAIAIAKGKSTEEIRYIAAIIFQLASTLITLSSVPPECNKEQPSCSCYDSKY